MRKTLRRACSACAKAKHSCDLRTPRCSRCVKRDCSCVYANEPLTATSTRFEDIGDGFQSPQVSKFFHSGSRLPSRSRRNVTSDVSELSISLDSHLIDPFDSYPSTNLPRLRVQALMQHFLTKIAFQYYPLDLNPASNPFVTSWWPLALTDPALFHVTLQTASLDDELRANKGFPHSEILMKDSVSLLRDKIQYQSLAFQDATMNAVVTLAAIEHGKGNLHVSRMHVDGVKGMIAARGGLSRVKQSNPLTARMVAWVSMLVAGSPQFDTQDDFGGGNGVSAIPEWQCQFAMENQNLDLLNLDTLGLDPIVANTVNRLRSVFNIFQTSDGALMLSTTDLHDLTCFMLHRLLSLPPLTGLDILSTATSECLRYAVSLYMFIIHGSTYYSHANMLNILLIRFEHHIDPLLSSSERQDSLLVWFLSIGAVASLGMNESQWFYERLTTISITLELKYWADVERHLKQVLWLETPLQILFQQTWEEIIKSNSRPDDLVAHTSESSTIR